MVFSIDRFEGNYAICESDDQKLYSFKLSTLPKGVKPGDIIFNSSDGTLKIDQDETIRRKENIKNLQDKLFR